MKKQEGAINLMCESQSKEESNVTPRYVLLLRRLCFCKSVLVCLSVR